MGGAYRLANETEAERLQDCLVLVHAIELVRGVVDVQRRGALADPQEITDFPGGLALHRPAQRLELFVAWGPFKLVLSVLLPVILYPILIPLFAVIWAWLLLGETPTWPMLVAGILILGSVALAQAAPQKP